jgi:DNA-binding HxlR family transcriptional regulator
MKRSNVEHLNCSIARSLEILGEWWTLLILRNAFFGVRRFEDFVEDLKISRGILSDRLATLVEHGILERSRYQQRPDRFEYRLTDKGRDLFPVIVALLRWGDTWESEREVGGAPVILTHDACGNDITGPLHCSHCHGSVDVRDVTARPGPGARADDRAPRATGSRR